MAGVQPTPTQSENDRAAEGEHVVIKEWDGSPVDPNSPDPTQPPGGPGVPEPEIGTFAPNSGPLPDVDLVVNGGNFTDKSVIVFDGVPQATTMTIAGSELRASIVGFAGPAGDYELFVRDPAGDSRVVTFTFVNFATTEEPPKPRSRK
ncbi:hypothetical protein J4G43_047210 [Bradyrhizobium barranii subsp. barranii]|uniref:IPT/TIG domain-containing protein n=1 Tax=Bradyrhizobium barranii subsp. barranii TaxID=2823807 RepID=A0A939MJ78_9BRAD|nr:hypothetical protein [Bradyrhizobium barranii]UEM11957.1 hypothetical protein J4G43_047210 [Bradyrhizobium barranii subsp. barranii]